MFFVNLMIVLLFLYNLKVLTIFFFLKKLSYSNTFFKYITKIIYLTLIIEKYKVFYFLLYHYTTFLLKKKK